MKPQKSLYNRSRLLKRLSLISGLVFFYFLSGNTQIMNLVLNGGFEEYIKCPTEQGNFDGYVEDWFTIKPSPEYFNECGFTFRPLLNFVPRTGNGFAGLRNFSTENPGGREFISIALKRQLMPKEKVLVTFYFLQSDRNYIIDKHSLLFTSSKIPFESSPTTTFYLNYLPQINWNGGLIKEYDNYFKVEGCYTATGGESFITIGNFSDQNEVQIERSNNMLNTVFSYTVYDDISIVPVANIKPNDTTLCMLDSFYFKDMYDIGFIPVYRGDTLSHGFLPGQPGEYGIELHWGFDCGPLDTLKVTFMDCSSCIDPISEVDLCVDAINFNPSDYIPAGLHVQDTFVAACPGKYNYPVYHPHCAQAIDTLTIRVEDYLQCFPEIKLDDQCRGTAVTLPALEFLEYKFNPEVSSEWEDLGMFTYEVINGRCQDIIIESELEVLPCDDCAVYVPNAFTPNRDGINDVFSVYTECKITGFEALVYDRWGNLITESDQLQNIWDGKGYENGVYVYSLRLRHRSSDGEREKRLTGTITLIR